MEQQIDGDYELSKNINTNENYLNSRWFFVLNNKFRQSTWICCLLSGKGYIDIALEQIVVNIKKTDYIGASQYRDSNIKEYCYI